MYAAMNTKKQLLRSYTGCCLLLLIILLSVGESFGQTRNYIRKTVYLGRYTTPQADPPIDSAMREITYYDGLGRPVQTVSVRANPGRDKDVVTPVTYDGFGRQDRDYLPYATATGVGGAFKAAALADQAAFYNAPPTGVVQIAASGGVTPSFGQRKYEPGPLSRVFEQGFPGQAWQPAASRGTSGRTVVPEQALNNDVAFSSVATTRRVARYDIVLASGTWHPTLVLDTGINGYYAKGELRVSITKDENWVPATGAANRVGTVEEYTDKDGRIVLRRLFNREGSTVQMLSTYYVYDNYGNLAFVFPPESGPDRASLPAPGATRDAWLASYAYQYRYDERNRLVEKQLPGKGREYVVYNTFDEVVATQDSVQRLTREWTVTKYDKLGRVVQTGIWNNANAAITRAALQTLVNSWAAANLHESRTTTGNGYTNIAWPTTSITTTLTLQYYDNYTAPGIPPTYSHTGSTMTVGLPTVSRVKVLDAGTGTGNMLWDVSYYNNRGEVTRQFSQHYKGGGTASVYNYDVTDHTYTFSGQPLTSTRRHYIVNAGGTAAVLQATVATEQTYDHRGRLGDTRMQVDGQGSPVLVSRLVYNDVGQLADKRLHSLNGGTAVSDHVVLDGDDGVVSGQQSVVVAVSSVTLAPGFHAQPGSYFHASIGAVFDQDIHYTYNERGWLRKADNTLFSEELRYNTGSTAQYNGNIADQVFTRKHTTGATVSGTYSYTYDAVNRLLKGTMSGSKGAEMLTYDRNGNIRSLQRTDGAGALVDRLQYDYADWGNRLKIVYDTVATTFTGDPFQLPGTTDYTYDGNGNLKTRVNRNTAATHRINNISGVSYNHLNLPKTVTVDGGTVSYTYDANGRKLRSVNGIYGQTREYIDGIEYSGTVIELIGMPEGRILKSGNTYTYEYFLKDHLGNNRSGFKGGTPGTATFGTDYYPFGLQYAANNAPGNPKNNYLYNGKEFQDKLKLYDYGARLYDPVTGRWGSVDPLSENHHGFSPFTYVLDNPMLYADLMGLDTIRYVGDTSPEVRGGDVLIDGNGNSSKVLPEAVVNYGSQQRENAFSAEYDSMRESYRKSAGGMFMGYPDNLVDRASESFHRKYYGGREVDPFTGRAIAGSGALVDANWIIDLGVGGITGGLRMLTSRGVAVGVTTADGFLFRGFTIKAPFNIPVQRFGNMSLGRPDFWGARIGTSQFANRTFGAITPTWNPLTQYTTGIISKGTQIKFGIIGPQGWRYPGGSFQFIVPSRNVINQSSKLIR